MGKSREEHDMRAAVCRLLEDKGYSVTDYAKGSGVPKLSRLLIKKGSDSFKCSVKTTSTGRISYTREDDGRYKVLSDVDRVIHVCSTADQPGQIRVAMFSKEVVVKAFEKNYTMLDSKGRGHLPLWVDADEDFSPRVVGSGFIRDAIWVEFVPILASSKNMRAELPASDLPEVNQGGVMAKIKLMLAEHMGVSADQLEVDVHVKV